jgi:LacI family transcriptional regulator
MEEKTGRVTIRTVAEDAGVSVAAVSKVMRNAYGVSEALRAKVMASIERLGYRPSVAARAMRGRTFTVGIVLVELGNMFLPELVEGVQDILGPANLQSLIGVGRAHVPVETALIERMVDYQMDGLILVAPRLSGEVLHHYAAKIPICVIGHHEATAASFDTVNSDDLTGADQAVTALIAAGHERIAMISLKGQGRHEHTVERQREQGYLRAMARAGLRPEIHATAQPPDYSMPFLTDLCRLPEGERPTAVFVWSDIHAVDLVNIARAQGLRVPYDMAIIGYDNTRVAKMPLIDLSSVDQSGRRIGQSAAELLLSRIEGRAEARHLLIEPRLVRRSSG